MENLHGDKDFDAGRAVAEYLEAHPCKVEGCQGLPVCSVCIDAAVEAVENATLDEANRRRNERQKDAFTRRREF